ncbi:MAG: papain-like cysteine protease family protein [Planctomycetota bacterium]
MANIVWAMPKPSRIEQINPSTCWLASCQVLYKWKGLPAGDIEKNLRKSDDARVDFDLWYKFGIDHGDAVPMAKALGFRWGAGGELTLDQLTNAVRNFGPMIAIGAWNTNSHVIVVSGVEQVTDHKYDSVAKIFILNPWFISPDPEEKNLYWFNGGLGHWKGVNGQYIHW